MRKIAVIGAGITGVTTAYALLNRGYEVTVFDRNRYSAMETSFANGGQLSASNAEVWNSWTTVFKGLKWMFKADAPLLVNPRPSMHKLGWMAEFMANIPNYRKNTVTTTQLAIAAREHLKANAAREGFDFDIEERGILHIYKHAADLVHARKVNELLASGGLERVEVGADDVYAIEPALKGRYIGGFFTKSDFTGDIHKYTIELAAASARRGVQFVHGAAVDRLTASGHGHLVHWKAGSTDHSERFDGLVICAGVHSRDLAAQVGDRVNIYPVKGYSITVNLPDARSQEAAPTVSILDDAAKVVASRLGKDRFRIAGTAEFNGYNRDIRADRIKPLVDWCQDLCPDVSTEHCVPWAGLRPMMPNMLPKVGAGKRPGIFYNTGHGHLGWTLSAVTAEMAADAVVDSQRTRSLKVGKALPGTAVTA
jgi:D-amino-acid dehydrogenase